MSTSWWTSLLPAELFYWGVAIFATLLQLILFVAGIFGGGGHDFDHPTDFHDGSSAGGKILSLRALTAFFLGFGWGGVLALQQGMASLGAALVAVGTGVVFTALLLGTLRLLMSLRDEGTLRYENAVGLPGRVYVTVPPNRSGIGQVELMLQGRLITAGAVTESPAALAPQSAIQVTAVEGGNVLLVAPAKPSA